VCVVPLYSASLEGTSKSKGGLEDGSKRIVNRSVLTVLGGIAGLSVHQ